MLGLHSKQESQLYLSHLCELCTVTQVSSLTYCIIGTRDLNLKGEPNFRRRAVKITIVSALKLNQSYLLALTFTRVMLTHNSLKYLK